MIAEPAPVPDGPPDPTPPGETTPQHEPAIEWEAMPAAPAWLRPVPAPTIDRLPPHDLDSEKAILGSILIDRDALGEVSGFLAPGDFYRQAHAWVYRAMLAIDRRSEPLDVVTVAAELERAGELETVGGASFLSILSNETPTSVHVAGFARIVADRSRERATIMAAGRIAEAAYERAPDLAERVSEIVAGLPRAASVGKPIGSRTACDLRHGTAPPQLAGPFLTAEGPTVLYARGGTGKGLLACWFALQLVRAGHVVMVVDFEGHETEWGSRLRGLGLSDDELGQIHYRAPFGSDWTAPTGSLTAVADAIRDDANRLGVTYIVVDSYSVATSNGDTMGGEAAAREYFSGLARIGLPSLTIAHVRGDSGKFPERPFGSVFVHNLARETWAVEQIGNDEPETIDLDEIRFGPHVVALELRNKKANARSKSPAQFVTFSFFPDCTIEVTTDQPAGRSVADLAADALADGPLTILKIIAAIKEDTGQVVSEDTLRNAFKRHPRRFEQSTSGRPRTWSVR